jgi:hypothetical protein
MRLALNAGLGLLYSRKESWITGSETVGRIQDGPKELWKDLEEM